MRILTSVLLAAVAMSVAACGSSRSARLGQTAFNPASDAPPATTSRSVTDQVLVAKLDDRDRILATEAIFDALERGRSGEPLRWDNPANGHFGEILPQAPYQRTGLDCRDYIHTVYLDRRPGTSGDTIRASACRKPDGSWVTAG